MNVLLDRCISASAASIVRQGGHDVVWAGDWSADPGDAEILHRAASESRVLATIDKDFGERTCVALYFRCLIAARVAYLERDYLLSSAVKTSDAKFGLVRRDSWFGRISVRRMQEGVSAAGLLLTT